jgi:circadian clock protein KaiC
MEFFMQLVSTKLKVRTGIEGFDDVTGGGLPAGRTTLIEGGPGSGKTILALQTLVNGARIDGEAGVFVAFEETADRITANASQFGWDLVELQQKKLFFLNAQQSPDLMVAGEFDLSGLIAVIEAKVKEIDAKRIVFDAIDVVLALLADRAAVTREVYRLHEWLVSQGLTAIITSKTSATGDLTIGGQRLDILPFMVDCAIVLKHDFVFGVSQRNLRIVKYRGSAFHENDSPLVIGPAGIEVAGPGVYNELPDAHVTDERISTGVSRLDTMLGGGYYRASTVLITGFPGTAKTTLAGTFLQAACERGERTLFVSFDSDAAELTRNLASVNIRLQRFVDNGLLTIKSARTLSGSAEIHLMRIRNLAIKHEVRCMVIDPISALAKVGDEATAYNVAERLIEWTKASGITLLCTSLLDSAGMGLEGTPMQISTIADTWIHLNYLVQAGERNRGLSIVKSRGTGHSNQVRELILAGHGVTLADAYTAGGEVLMGTLRYEKETAHQAAQMEFEASIRLKRFTLESEEELIEARLKAVQRELEAKRAERKILVDRESERSVVAAHGRIRIQELRGVDV